MKAADRAAQAWAVLSLAASNRQILTYHILARCTGIAPQGLGQILEYVQSYCLLNNLPALTSIVVLKDSGLPSFGFTAAEDVPREWIRVFEYDWLEHGCPGSESLEVAQRDRPSRGERPAAPAPDV